MKTIQNTIRQLRYQKLVTGLLLAAFYRLLLEGRIIRRVSLIDQPQEVPVGGYPPDRIITKNSAEWRLIYKATKQADEEITRWWSPRASSVLAQWFSKIEYLFVFYSTEGNGGTYLGMTNLGFIPDRHTHSDNKQAVHLALYDRSSKPIKHRILSGTVIHEGLHLREARHGLLKQWGLKRRLKSYIRSGNSEPWFHLALNSKLRNPPMDIGTRHLRPIRASSPGVEASLQKNSKMASSQRSQNLSRKGHDPPRRPTNHTDQ